MSAPCVQLWEDSGRMSEAANGEGTAPQILQFPTTPTPETPPTTPPMEPPADITGIEMVEIRQDRTPYETKNFGYRHSSE